jgi:heptose-I-phosphate ethanolaminephosphotransferase
MEMKKETMIRALDRAVHFVLHPVRNCRTLLLFSFLMTQAITIVGNIVEATTDPFLSFLLPIFDCYLLCVLAGWLKRVRLGFLVGLFVTVILFSELFTVFFYHSNFTVYVLLLVFETNTKESSEFIQAALGLPGTWYAVLLTLVIAALSFGLACLSRKPFRWKKIIMFVTFALILWSGLRQLSAYTRLYQCFSSASTTVCNDPKEMPHLNTPFVRLAYGVAYNRASQAELYVLEESVRETVVDSCSYRCPLIVLVIGESYNKHHTPLYEPNALPTTPRLMKQHDEGRLFVYKDAVAPYNFTSNAFKYMFTLWDDSDADEWTRHTLFPAVFKKAGYCVDFLSNQFTMEQTHVWDFAGGTIFNRHGLSELQFHHRNPHVFRYDGELIEQIPPLDSLLARPTLLIVHLLGQHVKYDLKYPEEFARFTADDERTPFGGELGRQTAAHYDNATYYNDFVVDSIFQMVRTADAIGIYLSDHGEEVFDWRDKYERTNEGTLYPEVAYYQYEIPLMFFMTDTFQMRHPDVAEAVRTSADRRFLSNDLPHLLLYLGGIGSPEYKEKRNILSPHYDLNRKRIIRNDVDYDELMKDFRR